MSTGPVCANCFKDSTAVAFCFWKYETVMRRMKKRMKKKAPPQLKPPPPEDDPELEPP